MSLTAELRSPDSPVRRYFEARFPLTEGVCRTWTGRVAALPAVCPRPAMRHYPAATVGQALDYRIRYTLDAAPSGALLASAGAALLTGRAVSSLVPRDVWPLWTRRLGSFFESLDALVSTDAPDEDRLCACCFVLALLESLYRAGDAAWSRSPLRDLDASATDADLLALASAEEVADIRALAQVFVERVKPQLAEPWTCNPNFAGSDDIFGADADLICGGLLVDIKTVARASELPVEWLYQLLGYVLLDYDDAYKIDAVGIYLARHGALVRWELTELLDELSGGRAPAVQDLRAEFRSLLRAARPV